jgi:glycosyltransferase involved in cell wall biosynthesis
MPVLAIELSGNTSEYLWDKADSSDDLERITLFPEQNSRLVKGSILKKRVFDLLNRYKPDAVAINGWSDKGAFAALNWCLQNRVPAIAMSESSAEDQARTSWKEGIKKAIVKQFSAGLVGGSRHIKYLTQLGIPEEYIFTGYDVIDNAYFAIQAQSVNEDKEKVSEQLQLPPAYFLTSNRFIEKKNLIRLIHAYAQYRKLADGKAWDLVMLGDGELRSQIQETIDKLGLVSHVHLKGFQQYANLPAYYGLAQAFIHASTSEQWGLVVNEAMAAGLPVIVSERCGCAPDLVKNGVNGYVFNPYDTLSLAQYMLQISKNPDNRLRMGNNSKQIIEGYKPENFALGLEKAVHAAIKKASAASTLKAQLLLNAFIYL